MRPIDGDEKIESLSVRRPVRVQPKEAGGGAPTRHGHAFIAQASIGHDGRAKVVYHKDGGKTHCWRIANDKDDAIENYTGQWFLGQLVGWNNWPSVDLRNKAMEDFGGPRAKLRDEAFADNLRKAMDGSITGFDPNIDG
ncbi:hypothetical protein MAPG_04302 [Magnaporthiopsis poae ATCC 64411]|uniref:Uncharacterized protein n=1 Tax=Magnaporthiopsis poae (strain ATCC 64411 / 73-15) TaxID=644358 RepID=A0A0C4DWC6_MAGP6|nr:hypothetical protein MAPG_04302 [Magnaporthiopsis poae ATCC 64411]